MSDTHWSKYWRWLGIRGKLLAGFILLVFLAAATAVILFYNLVKSYEHWLALDEEVYVRQQLAYQIRLAFGEELSNLRAHFAFGDLALQDQVLRWQREADLYLEQARNTPFPESTDPLTRDSELLVMKQLYDIHEELKKLFREEMELRQQGKTSEWTQMALKRNVALVSDFHSRTDFLIQKTEQILESARNQRSREKNNALGSGIALVGILLALSAIVGVLLTRKVAWPLRQLSDATRELAAGNFRLITGVFGDDELGDLARSFNEMSVSLEERQAYILQRNRELTTLSRLTALLSKATELDQYADELVSMVLDALPANAVGFYSAPDSVSELELKAHRGLPVDFVEIHSKVHQPPMLLGQKIDPDENTVLDSLDATIHDQVQILREEGLSSAVIVPISNTNGIVALLLVCARGLKSWPLDQLSLLSTVGRQLSLVSENFDLVRERVQSARFAAMGQAISDIGHTIKNLVGGLQASTFLMEEALKTREFDKYPKILNVLKDVTKRISTFMQDLLSFSRVQELSMEPVRVEDLLRELLTIHEYQASQEGIDLQMIIADEGRVVRLDRKAIVNALSNLVVNAIDALKQQPVKEARILLTSRTEHDGSAIFTVEDNGSGIPPAVLDRIWDAFFTTKGSKGTGLGLSLVRRIAEQHTGTITVSSLEGRGTVFRIVIPQ